MRCCKDAPPWRNAAVCDARARACVCVTARELAWSRAGSLQNEGEVWGPEMVCEEIEKAVGKASAQTGRGGRDVVRENGGKP